ncbi:MAG: AAA family ATPase [Anaerolineae bacterium]
MKNLLFICGANGIGKTTICNALVRRQVHTAYIDSDGCRVMNPFVLNEDTIPTIRKNISDMIRNYLGCPIVRTVVFSYGLHGRRREIFDGVTKDLADMEYRFIPVLLVCDVAENIRRLSCNGRDTERISRAVQLSRAAYSAVDYPRIDVTNLSVEDSVSRILDIAGLEG